MLTQASFEALRLHFVASGLNGNEAVYVSRFGDSDIAFVAIAPNGNITTYKKDSYPEDLLEQEIMTLCCAKYGDNTRYIPQSLSNEKSFIESSDYTGSMLIELVVASIVFVLSAIFLVIFWVLLRDSEKTLIIGAVICLPVVLFVISVFKARLKVYSQK